MRFPDLAAYLPFAIQGYEKCPEAALAILEYAGVEFEVDSFVKAQNN